MSDIISMFPYYYLKYINTVTKKCIVPNNS